MSTPEPQSLDAGTEYVVLMRLKVSQDAHDGSRLTWCEVGRASVRSADAAVREVVGKLKEDERKGQFVAVPSRSWKPVGVSEKVERTLVIGG